ncbi:ribosome hibernation-promoting factor, HPF/YfiA family [Ferroacidibacillus organovorans]|uniref:Ribosome hibernation promoting factor n=1 Tax=Ferroacidibacillus organovorans TaxID=1765683 RepID=A0A162UFV8_9BACL|nr:ribosome-associated translation inhibitor RaiA [Ferroacidibacillus organovorans]KYP81723.1 Fis family transcriptional regulator [Ferroacidibacillus organovorans]OAG94263.1 Fis family transcriptional regulator [Ferroacidibacillus organovorans]OPG16902.1 ribosomal subunit interface protein [Ferroacidibacillus organovorans]
MNIHIRGDHHLDVTQALKQYVEKKVGRMERYLEASQVHDVSVTMSVTRGIHTVEVMVPLGQAMLRAEERSDDMYASVDLVMDKLEKQLEKYRHRAGQKVGHRLKVEGFKAKEGPRVSVTDEQLEEDEADVVRVKRFDMKPMYVSEAILQMDLLGHDFFVFANAEDEKTSVVYRRRDGQFGLIQSL